jgi:hypothetical protein
VESVGSAQLRGDRSGVRLRPDADRAAGALIGSALLAAFPEQRDGETTLTTRLPTLTRLLAQWLLGASPAGPLDTRPLAAAIAETVRARPDLDWPLPDVVFAQKYTSGVAAAAGAWEDASAAARSMPVALLPAVWPAEVGELARRTAAVTHACLSVQEAAAVHAVGVMHLVRGGAATPEALLPAVCAVAGDELTLPLAVVADLLSPGDGDEDASGLRVGGSWWARAMLGSTEWVTATALDAIPTALYAFLLHPTDCTRARDTALLLSPDAASADSMRTLGALVGALVGAHVGARRLSLGYRDCVPELVQLAGRLVSR